MRLIRQKKQELFSISIYNINRHLNKQDKKETDFKEVLLKEYWKYLNIFLKKTSDRLSEYNLLDYHIELEKDLKKILWNPPLYQMSMNELKTVKKYLKNNLNKSFI